MGKSAVLDARRTEAQVLSQVLEAALCLGVDLDRQNTGAGVNPSGKLVRFGTPGNTDLSGMLPDGRKLDVEVKHEGFNPSKLRGRKREHFERQLERLKKTNAQGGVGFYTDDSEQFLTVMRHVLAGASVVEDGYGPLKVVVRKEHSRG